MTNSDIGGAGSREVVFVLFDGMQLLDLAGPLEVFDAANRLVGRTVYRSRIAALGSHVATSSGASVETVQLSSIEGALDTVIVVGGLHTNTERGNAPFVAEIQRLAASSSRVCSVCTGAFLLAEAGVLDGRMATTHWAYAGSLQRRFPRVRVQPDPIFVQDGHVWTSAGVTAGIDMALALVADDLGSPCAADAARWLVLPARRLGLQSQFSPELAGQSAAAQPFADLITWMRTHLEADLSVSTLAERMHLSERHFARRFTAAVGQTPSAYVEALRLDAARRLLESGEAGVAAIARRVGFRNRETMQRAFQRRFGTSPSTYRQTFAA